MQFRGFPSATLFFFYASYFLMNPLEVGGHVGKGSAELLGGGEVQGVSERLMGRGAAHHPQYQLQVRYL